MTVNRTLPETQREVWSGMISDDPCAEVGVLGVPFDRAVSFRAGTSFAPARLRELSQHLCCCAEEGQALNLRVRDYGDVPADLEWSRYFQKVEEQAKEVLQHAQALFLGGDHSVTIPLMRAFNDSVHAPFGVIHFDAHLDLFDTLDGHRWSHACTERRAVELSGLDPQHLVFVGVRSFCQEEQDFLKAHPEIACYTSRQCYQRGIEKIAEEIVERLRGLEAVYFTLDIDGLDPAYAPGTGIPEAAGLSTRDLLELARVLFLKLPIRAWDVVEVAPPLDHSDITAFAALKAIYEAWGAVQEKQSLSAP
jgi:agmatinase